MTSQTLGSCGSLAFLLPDSRRTLLTKPTLSFIHPFILEVVLKEKHLASLSDGVDVLRGLFWREFKLMTGVIKSSIGLRTEKWVSTL